MKLSLNYEMFMYYPVVRFFRKSLAIPHFSVKDIRSIHVDKLKGFKGIVFDKDNTLTYPYSLKLYPEIEDALKKIQEVFGDKAVILSNSSGCRDDKDYVEAEKIERELGIPVLRHNKKKPACVDVIKQYFGCEPSELVMVGDGVFSDVVLGNRCGMLTIMTQMLTLEGERKSVAGFRAYENRLVRQWKSKGVVAPEHSKYNPEICIENI